MGFLFPLYLLGALAVAIPIALHLRRRPPKDRVVFSSLMFLDPHAPQRKRRSKLENLFLLMLRCLALLLLALLFSRPFLRDPEAMAEAAPGSVKVVLVDRSASMQRDGLWDAAKTSASDILDDLKPEDRVALLAFDRDVETLISFQEWNEMPYPNRKPSAKRAIDSVEPGWSDTSVDAALVEAVGLIEDETQGALVNRQIILVSDMQEGADLARLDNFAWPEGISLRLLGVAPVDNGNAAAHLVAQLAAEDDEEDDAEQALALRVRVTNAADAEAENFTLAWDRDPANAVDLRLPPGATRVVSAPPRPKAGSEFLELKGDSAEFDNRLFVAPPEARPVRVLFIGENTDAGDTRSPLFYLQRAFSATETLEPEVAASKPGELSRDVLEESDVIVLADRPGVEQAQWLNDFLKDGGVMFLALWDAGDAPSFIGELGIEIAEAEVSDYAMLENLDFEHPVLRIFAAPGLRDFSKIHFWKYRQLTLPEPQPDSLRVLAEYDSGDPALLEVRVEKGRVFLFTSNWVPAESQLALSSKFVPLIYSILRVAGFENDAARQFFVGDELPVPDAAAEVTGPDGSESTGSTQATLPGVYTITHEGETLTYAVNVPVSESKLDPLQPDAFTTLGVTLAEAGKTGATALSEAEQMRLEVVELEARQKIWKWLILAVVVIFILETWLANRRGRAQPQEPAPA